jgi:hypothetical protein
MREERVHTYICNHRRGCFGLKKKEEHVRKEKDVRDPKPYHIRGRERKRKNREK